MKIAITADVHLRTRAEYPERYNALENILSQMNEKSISHLIIAGDLFDKNFQEFSDFEALCKKFSNIQLYIIRGNHDEGLVASSIVADNVKVFDKPELFEFEPDTSPFLFVPYEQTSLGEKISAVADKLTPNGWILVGHSNYTGGHIESNQYEAGVYMPLSRQDVHRFRPAKVFIGHIHKKMDDDNIHYPGSPCGLDINETGKRSFIIFDTATKETERQTIESDIIWFNEKFVMIPAKNELDLLGDEITIRTNTWNLEADDIAKTKIRVTAEGYSTDRNAANELLKEKFSAYTFHDDAGPDVSDLKTSTDEQRKSIAFKVKEKIMACERPTGPDQPDNDAIINAALNIIYGK